MVVTQIQGFLPVVGDKPNILILGSAPSVASLQHQQYYAYPRNAFWKIILTLTHQPLDLPYQSRIEVLKQNHIALWDVVHSAQRVGSLDSAFVKDSLLLNPIGELLSSKPSIKKVFFNGQFAYQTFTRAYKKQPWFVQRKDDFIPLWSTSPANASKSFIQKLENWRLIMQYMGL